MLKYDDFDYDILQDGSVSIVIHHGHDKYIEIPSEIDGRKVAKIEPCAFIHDLRSVIIPDGVVEIGAQAFDGCGNLDYVDIPASVKKIGKNAFRECDDRLVVAIHDIASWCDIDFENYEANPLNMCGKMKMCGQIIDKLDIPQGVKIIKQYAFYGANIDEIILPKSVEKIGECAFAFCSDVCSLHIPSKLVDIGVGAFDDTISTITRITADRENARYYADGNCLIERNTRKLVLGCRSSVIPYGTKIIGSSAFYSCGKLERIEIPNSIERIEDMAFAFCKGLKSIVIPSSVKYIGSDAFSNCHDLTIYCEAKQKPDSWAEGWNCCNHPVVWKAK